MKTSEEIKNGIKKVLPKIVGVEVEYPPLKVRGRSEWMPAGVARIEGRKRFPKNHPERRR